MATSTPTTDPLWAYNTSGWTNQGNTGDLETSAGGNATNIMAPYDANLNGVLAQTMDSSSAVVDGFTPAITTGILYAGLVYVAAPVITKKFFVSVTTQGTATHAYVALLSPGGVTLAASADLTTLASGAGSWAASATLASGYYYLGFASVSSVASKLAGAANAAVLAGNAAGLVYAAGGPYPKWVTSTVTITSAFPASATLAAQTTGSVGAPYVAML